MMDFFATLPEWTALAWAGTPLWLWASFAVLVAAVLAFDLNVTGRAGQAMSFGASLRLSALYIAIGLAFGAGLWWRLGAEAGMAYVTGFVIEKTLALDNIFVMALIFSYFGVPAAHQRRVLLWGILGVVVLRAIMIALGAALVARFGWVLDLFAVFLIFTGIKMLMTGDEKPDLSRNPLIAFLRRRLNVTDTLHGERFLVRLPDSATGRLVTHATPLLLALIVIELADILFAVDSVPAIFAITSDPFIVYTSNIFAILGLRALYVALAALVHRFQYLKPALAVLLVFIGAKVFVADFLGWEKFPAIWSLGITFAIVSSGIAISLVASARASAKEAA